MMRIPAAVAVLAFVSIDSLPAQVPQYRLVDSIAVGAVGDAKVQYDFFMLDVNHRRLYGAGPFVVDVDKGATVSTLADSTAHGGFVIAPELGRGLVRNGTVFDLNSGAVVGHVAARGDASAYDPRTGRAFLFGDSVAVVDMKSASLVSKVHVSGAGESGVADGKGKVYLNLMDKDSIAVLDATTLTVTGGYSVAPCKKPRGLAMDRAHRRLFVACDGELGVVDADNGKVVALVPTGGYSDENAFDPGTGLIFMPNFVNPARIVRGVLTDTLRDDDDGRGKDGLGRGVTIVHEDSPDHYTVVQRLFGPAIRDPRIVVDEQTHRAYMPYNRGYRQQFYYVVLAPVK